MISVSSKVLSLAAEAALLVRGGTVVYANPAAEAFLGGACAGKSLKDIFSEDCFSTSCNGIHLI